MVSSYDRASSIENADKRRENWENHERWEGNREWTRDDKIGSPKSRRPRIFRVPAHRRNRGNAGADVLAITDVTCNKARRERKID